jgi:ubiquinone/menaquinone biosynthesis C-methylase UbiE
MNLLQESPFDNSSVNYDSVFTHSVTGMEQRKIVWRYLSKYDWSGRDVLEINCGTGEDAFFLARLGCKVLATDASQGMISQCILKSKASPVQPSPEFRKASFTELEALVGNNRFDLVLSDFSGLNCIDHEELKRTSLFLNNFLKPGGRMIIVVFGKHCIWEKLYMLYKGRLKDLNRRSNSVGVLATVSGYELSTFYYSPKDLRQIFQSLKFVASKPVGLCITPTYLDSFFINKSFLFKVLKAMENIFGRISFLSDFADHYLIEFKKV